MIRKSLLNNERKFFTLISILAFLAIFSFILDYLDSADNIGLLFNGAIYSFAFLPELMSILVFYKIFTRKYFYLIAIVIIITLLAEITVSINGQPFGDYIWNHF